MWKPETFEDLAAKTDSLAVLTTSQHEIFVVSLEQAVHLEPPQFAGWNGLFFHIDFRIFQEFAFEYW